MGGAGSREFWDEAARNGAAWYVATGHRLENEEFFRQGAAEADTFLRFCGVEPGRDKRLLEIGCGVGRMTRRFAELFGTVLAADVSGEMLRRCRENLASFGNVGYLEVSGDGTLPGVSPGEVDVVFSYLTFQHVPTARAQLRYFESSASALASQGRIAVQVRSSSPLAAGLAYAGGLVHLAQGRHTLSRPWQGSRVRPRPVLECLRRGGVDATVEAWPHHPPWSPAQWWVMGAKR